jgi:hypothetical protein
VSEKGAKGKRRNFGRKVKLQNFLYERVAFGNNSLSTGLLEEAIRVLITSRGSDAARSRLQIISGAEVSRTVLLN